MKSQDDVSGTGERTLASVFPGLRAELASYLRRLVVRPEVADELVQETALKYLEANIQSQTNEYLRPWMFRVATILALDHLRRHSTWREQMLVHTREAAVADDDFVAASGAMVGSAETSAIAREHLAVCLSCTMRLLPRHQAAALLLTEVYGFSLEESAGMLEASSTQAKNWLQAARRKLRDKYASTSH